jgi:hypothetical protein
LSSLKAGFTDNNLSAVKSFHLLIVQKKRWKWGLSMGRDRKRPDQTQAGFGVQVEAIERGFGHDFHCFFSGQNFGRLLIDFVSI